MAPESVGEGMSLHLPSRFGDLPYGWSWRRLDDACEGVFDCPHSTPPLVESGPLVVRSQDIITGVFRTEQAAHVSEATYQERTSKAVPVRGDLLYSREGTYLGVAAEVPERTRVCLGQRMVLIRPKVGIVDYRFLCHWLNSPIMVSHIHGYRDGTVAERLNLPTIRALPVLVPPLHVQRVIAAILGDLNDKIELNQRMNETLEAMARALYKSWFVDFDPVRCKIEGRDTGFAKSLTNLFPSNLVDSEFGKIPEGWAMGALRDVCTLNPEAWSKETRPSTISYVDLSNTKWGRIDSIAEYHHQDAPSRAQRVLRPRDTIVGTVRPGNGSYAYISEEGLTGSTGFAVLRPTLPDYAPFVYLAATARDNIDELARVADGGAYPAVRPEAVVAMPVIRANDGVLQEFARLARPILERIAVNENESMTLASLRDALLPKLLSGELLVKNATSVTAEANS